MKTQLAVLGMYALALVCGGIFFLLLMFILSKI